ncbi:MAG: hypothetical protein JNL38_30660 [Myxococcales bacterium]|nr:hypothetical protein [Myxococcales bacterium]
MRRWLGVSWIVLVAVAAGEARADDKAACLAASEKAQQLRNAGKLSAARAELTVCGRPECPAVVRQDCATWMNEIIASSPSVVFDAKDGKGKDLVDVRVFVDDKQVADQIDGKPIQLDPGQHVFRFESTGLPPVEERVVIKQGEKNRIVSASFRPAGADRPPPPPPAAPVEDSSGRTVMTVASIGLIGIGAVGLGVGAVLGLQANSTINDLKSTCGVTQTCPQGDVDAAERKRNLAIGAAVAGGAFVAGGVVLFLLRPAAPKATAIRMEISPNPGGASLGLRGAF